MENLWNSLLNQTNCKKTMISKKTVKAIDIATVVARYSPGQPVPAHEISALLGLSISYIEVTLSDLKNHAIVRAYKGPGGGYQLDEKNRPITLWDIVKIFEPHVSPSQESTQEATPLADMEREMRQRIQEFFESRTLTDLARQTNLPAREKTEVRSIFKLKPLPQRVALRVVNSVFDWKMSALA
jgi:Rrf2 family iron-sulfur cluster assembly transcriptional regulator